MALEPITRQEQIIAGKDLEPITRMEKFLKEYSGGDGGIPVKKAVFTDRPSLWEWLSDDYSKVIYCNVINSQYPWYTKYMVHAYGYSSSTGQFDGFGLVQINSFGGHTLVPSTIQITNTDVILTVDEHIDINADNTVTGMRREPTTIPDEYWSTMGIKVTIYYFDE